MGDLCLRIVLAVGSIGLDHFRWYRKWRGGRWELWWVDSPINSKIWHHRGVEEDMTTRPTGLCRGTPIVEDYRVLARVVKGD